MAVNEVVICGAVRNPIGTYGGSLAPVLTVNRVCGSVAQAVVSAALEVAAGAIAHGQSIGATGAILTNRLLHAMQRDGPRRGIVMLCIGGGQAVALALERI